MAELKLKSILDKLKWLPEFGSNKERNAASTTLTMLYFLFSSAVLIMLSKIRTLPPYLFGSKVFNIAFVSAIVFLLMIVMLKKGFLRTSVILTNIFFLSMINYATYTGDGIHDVSMMMFPVLLILSCLTLKKIPYYIMSTAAVISATILGVGEAQGFIETRYTALMAPIDPLLAIIFVALVAVLVRVLTDALYRALAKAETSERNYREVYNATSDAIFIHDADTGEILEVNQAFENLFGYSRSEACSLNAGDLSEPDSRFTQELAVEKIRQAMSGRKQLFEWRCRRRNGTIFWSEVSLNGTRIGGADKVLAAVRDINERKMSEEQLNAANQQLRASQQQLMASEQQLRASNQQLIASEERFRSLVGNVPGAFYRCESDEHWTMRYISDAVVDICGYPATDFLGNKVRTFASVIHPEDRERTVRIVDEALATRAPYTMEYRLVDSHDSIHWVHERGRGVYNDGGSVRFLDGAIFDVTNRKLAEQALADEMAFTDSVINSLPGMFFMYEDLERLVRWNKNLEILTGYSADELKGRHPLDWFRKEDHPRVTETLGNIAKHVEASIEVDVLVKDGTAMPSFITGRVITLRGKQYLIGMTVDVSERRHAEEQLRESENRYRTISEAAFEGLVITERGRMVDANRAFLEMFGYTQDELSGKPVGDLIAQEDRDMVRDRVTSGYAEAYEHRALHKNGTVLNVEVRPSKVSIEGRNLRFTAIRDITDRERADEQLRESELQYRTLFESAGDAIFLMDEERFVECNKKTLEIFGCTREQIINAHPGDFSPDVQLDGTPSREAAVAHLRTVRKGKPQVFEWRHCRPDGSVFDAEVSLTLIVLGDRPLVFSIVRDITERQIAEKALRESEERFRQMAENIQESFFLIDRATRSVLYVSPAIESIFGIERGLIMQYPLKLTDSIHPDDRDGVQFADLEKRYDQPCTEEFRIVRPDGEIRWVNLRSFLVKNETEEAYRIAGIVADITDYRSAQESASLHQQQLIQADKMASVGMMVSGVAHEINNPNNLIMLNADVMQTMWKPMRKALDATYEEKPSATIAGLDAANAIGKFDDMLHGISGGSERIRNIVQNLKDFARVDTGEITESVSVPDVIDSALTIAHNMVKKATNKFRIIRGKNLPPVRGSFQKLEQVVINLISNACQALANKNQAIEISSVYDKKKKAVVLSVHDEGHGIGEDELNKVMDPFFTTKRDMGGTGLGLSVSYGIIKEHKGDISFESEPGKGTTVRVALPAAGRVHKD